MRIGIFKPLEKSVYALRALESSNDFYSEAQPPFFTFNADITSRTSISKKWQISVNAVLHLACVASVDVGFSTVLKHFSVFLRKKKSLKGSSL